MINEKFIKTFFNLLREFLKVIKTKRGEFYYGAL